MEEELPAHWSKEKEQKYRKRDTENERLSNNKPTKTTDKCG